jgi:thioredoxin 1
MFEAGMIAIGAGLLVFLIGGIWLLVIAIRESMTWEVRIWVVPFISFGYLFVFFFRTGRPALIALAALILVMGGVRLGSEDPERDTTFSRVCSKVYGKVNLHPYSERIKARWMSGMTRGPTLAKDEGTSRVDINASGGDPVPLAPPLASLTDEELIGLTRDELLTKLGKPTGTVKGAGGISWMYSDVVLDFLDGYIVSRVTRMGASGRSAPAAVAPVMPAEARAGVHPSVRTISNGGQEINLADYIGKGKVTIIDFHAAWCGPCRRIGPALRHLAEGDPGVELVKIDIVSWGTPVTHQYNIFSVPNMRVFDARGKSVGQACTNLRQLQGYLLEAKGRQYPSPL